MRVITNMITSIKHLDPADVDLDGPNAHSDISELKLVFKLWRLREYLWGVGAHFEACYTDADADQLIDLYRANGIVFDEIDPTA